MRKVKVGMVGFGTITRTVHAPVLSSFNDARMVSIAEVDARRRKESAKKWRIPQVYEDYKKMYEEVDLDAVFVCTPVFLHYDAVKSALEHDLHVFCEKPMGLKADGALELVILARKRNLVLAVGYNRRLEENYKETANVVRSSKLGDILQAHAILVYASPYAGYVPSSNWFFNDRYAVLYDSGCHLLDLMMYVLSDPITELSAKGISTSYGLNIFDNIAGVFKTDKETIGTFNVGWKVAPNYDAIQVYGTGGSVFADPWEIEVRHGSYGPLERVEGHIKSTKNIIRTQLGRIGRDSQPSETYFREDRAFIDAVLNGSDPLASGEDGFRVLRVLEAVKESIEKERVVKVN